MFKNVSDPRRHIGFVIIDGRKIVSINYLT